MNALFLGVGIAIGIVFATACMTVSMIIHEHNREEKHHKEVEEAFDAGYRDGCRWSVAQVIEVEREIDELEAELREVKQLMGEEYENTKSA